MPDACPACSAPEEEPVDYDVVGNDVFQCGECGIIYAKDSQGNTSIVNSAGF